MTNVDKVKNYSPFIDLVEGTIGLRDEPKVVFVKGEQKRVAEVELRDEIASVKLTLWEDQIDKVKTGDKIRISNGYITNYQGQNKLNISRNGKIEIIT